MLSHGNLKMNVGFECVELHNLVQGFAISSSSNDGSGSNFSH